MIEEKELLEELSKCKNIIMTEEVSDYILNQQNPKVSRKIIRDIRLLDQFGLALPKKSIHRIWESKEKLWELRTLFSNNAERTLFFLVSGGKYLLTNCFRKKSDDVPVNEIRKAENIFYEYQEDNK